MELYTIHGLLEFKEVITINGVVTNKHLYSYGKLKEVVYFNNTDTIDKYVIERIIDVKSYLVGKPYDTEILEYSQRSLPEEFRLWIDQENIES